MLVTSTGSKCEATSSRVQQLRASPICQFGSPSKPGSGKIQPPLASLKTRWLTPPSRGLACGQPLTSNVSHRYKSRHASLQRFSFGGGGNANAALSLAGSATGKACCWRCHGCWQLVPPSSPRQACGAGPSKSALPRTPVAWCSCERVSRWRGARMQSVPKRRRALGREGCLRSSRSAPFPVEPKAAASAGRSKGCWSNPRAAGARPSVQGQSSAWLLPFVRWARKAGLGTAESSHRWPRSKPDG